MATAPIAQVAEIHGGGHGAVATFDQVAQIRFMAASCPAQILIIVQELILLEEEAGGKQVKESVTYRNF